MRILPLAIALTLLSTSAIAKTKPKTKPVGDTLSGYLLLISGSIEGSEDDCYGTEGFRDINGMMPVFKFDSFHLFI